MKYNVCKSVFSFLFLFLLSGCTDKSDRENSNLQEDEYQKPFRLNTGKSFSKSFVKRGGESFKGFENDPLFIEHDTSLLHQAIRTETWDILNLLEYELEYFEGTPWYVPVFPPEINRLEGQIIELKGYMVPLEAGSRHDNFLISVLPLLQCHFCGTGGIPEMVEVFSKNQLRYTERIITVKGRLRLNDSDVNHFTFILEEAEML